MRKILLLLLLLPFCSKSQEGQRQVILTEETVYNFFLENYNSIVLRIHNAALDGKIKIYADKKLTNKISAKQYLDTGKRWRSLQIVNPENPTDIYDLIDTVVLLLFDGNPESVGFFKDKVFEYRPYNDLILYFKIKDVLHLLPAQERSFVNYILYTANYDAVDDMHNEKNRGMMAMIHYWVLNGRLTAYSYYDVKNPLTIEQYRLRTTTEKWEKVAVPVQSSYGWYFNYVDSLVTIPFEGDAAGIGSWRDGVIQYSLPGEMGAVYFKTADVAKLLNTTENIVAKDIFGYNEKRISSSSLKRIAEKEIHYLSGSFFHWGAAFGLVPCYKNISFDSAYTNQEIWSMGNITWQVPKWSSLHTALLPTGADTSTAIIGETIGQDSTEIIPFHTDSIRKIMLLYNTGGKNYTIKSELFGIAPCYGWYHPKLGQPMFWMKPKEAINHLFVYGNPSSNNGNKPALEIYKHIFHYAFNQTL